MKPLLPTICPACETPLTIEFGKKEDVIKLVCPNKECSGTALKKLQKGIIALDINSLGPKVIEKLSLAGITSSIDLFDKSKFNVDYLCSTGYFCKGRALDKIIEAVSKVKEIPIQKAILSLQLKDIGKTFSEKIGMLMSGIEPDYSGLQLNIREELSNKESNLYKTISDSIKKFEENDIKIIRYEVKKTEPIEIKKIKKTVASTIDITELISKLDWELVDVNDTNCQILVVSDKNEINEKVEYAKSNGIKIMTIKQIELVFN